MVKRNMKEYVRWICSAFVSAEEILPSMRAEYEMV